MHGFPTPPWSHTHFLSPIIRTGYHFCFVSSEYVNRAYQQCELSMDKDLMGIMLKGKITAAISSNELYTRDWDNEPIPVYVNLVNFKDSRVFLFRSVQRHW